MRLSAVSRISDLRLEIPLARGERPAFCSRVVAHRGWPAFFAFAPGGVEEHGGGRKRGSPSAYFVFGSECRVRTTVRFSDARVGEPVAVVLWKRAAQPISNPVGLISTGGDGRNAAGQAPTGQYSADQ